MQSIKFNQKKKRNEASPSFQAVNKNFKFPKKHFSSFYKFNKLLDCNRRFYRVKSYQNLKFFLAEKIIFKNKQIQLQEYKLKRHYNHVQEVNKKLEKKNIILIRDLFVDEKEQNILWIIYEEIDHLLFNPFYDNKIQPLEKKVIKHYEQIEVIQILENLLDISVKYCQHNLLINFKQFFVGFNDNQYKFMIQPSNQIFTKEKWIDQLKQICQLIEGFINELINAFLEVDETNQVDDMISYHQRAHFNEIESFIYQIKNMKGFTIDNVKEIQNQLQNKIIKYIDIFYVFRNENIFLMNQPIFNKLKKIQIQIDKNYKGDPNELINYISEILNNKSLLKILVLILPNFSLNTRDVSKIILNIKKLKNIKFFQVNFSNNFIKDEIIEQLSQGFKDKQLDVLELDLSHTELTGNSMSQFMQFIPNQKLVVYILFLKGINLRKIKLNFLEQIKNCNNYLKYFQINLQQQTKKNQNKFQTNKIHFKQHKHI